MSPVAERPALLLALPTLANGEWPVTAEGGPCVDCGRWAPSRPAIRWRPVRMPLAIRLTTTSARLRSATHAVDPLSWEEKFDQVVQEHGIEETLAAMQRVTQKQIVAQYWPKSITVDQLPVPDDASASDRIAIEAACAVSQTGCRGPAFRCFKQSPLGASGPPEGARPRIQDRPQPHHPAELRGLTRLGCSLASANSADWITSSFDAERQSHAQVRGLHIQAATLTPRDLGHFWALALAAARQSMQPNGETELGAEQKVRSDGRWQTPRRAPERDWVLVSVSMPGRWAH